MTETLAASGVGLRRRPPWEVRAFLALLLALVGGRHFTAYRGGKINGVVIGHSPTLSP
jgi:hypothetical protein